MRNALTVLFITALGTISPGQTSQRPRPEPAPQESVTQRRIVDLPLPKRAIRPKITLQHALKLAESYTAKEKIDLSPYYLYEAKYILCGAEGNQEPCWFFWWVNENGTIGDYVRLTVSIKTGNVNQLPSM